MLIRAKSVQYVRPLFQSIEAPTLTYASIDVRSLGKN
jgi:hypothetical protein